MDGEDALQRSVPFASGLPGFDAFFFLTGAPKLQSFGLAGTATKRAKGALRRFFFFLTGAHKLQSFGLAGTATKRAKGGYKATTASSWVKVKPLRAKSAAQIKTRRAPNADSNGR
ncbi:BQ5605_C007g04849 [Microbotryum silenes-dioicae]|uniref:BQ5605_C007g04849 protein n=1 Tax=Microbotryum silenes-dioicae TaxID=796604 RepID=A0A2X0MV95_9BASI|nr:BQ5605_C007g04849 [Microbotryum silenes-dioicae]